MLKTSALKRGYVVSEPGAAIQEVFFPIASVISTLTQMKDGAAIEVGLTGHDGLTGLALLYGARDSAHQTIVQIPDSAYCIGAHEFIQLLKQDAALKERAFAYAGYSFNAATQFAACNRLHPIEERYARWMLMADDRVGLNEFPLTQEFTAQMLGVRRAGVTVVAGTLSSAGLISYRRGFISVLDRPALEDVACECYRAVNTELHAVHGLRREADCNGRPQPGDRAEALTAAGMMDGGRMGLRRDALERREPDLEGEVDFDLAVEAAHQEAEARLGRLSVLGGAVGADERRVHGARIGAQSAYWVALCYGPLRA